VAGQQKALKSLAKRASPLIVALRNDAENTAYFSQLRKVVAETFDGYEAFNITDELGLPVLNYVGTHLGPRSSSNLQRLAQTRQAYNGMRMDNTRVNGVDHYHYDIVATWQHEDQRGFLVVSLKATSLVRFLSNVPLGHHLLLVLQGRQDHVELSKWGPKLSHTRNDRLLSTEMEYVLYSAYIPGTDWRLLAVYDDKLSAAGHSRIKWTTGVLIVLLWVFFGSVSLFVRRRNISNNKGVSSPVG
jgi:hypothetical protein